MTVEHSKVMSNPAVAPDGMTCDGGVDAASSGSSLPSEHSTVRLRSLVTEKFFDETDETHTRPKSSTLCDATTAKRSWLESSAAQSRTSACVLGRGLNFLCTRRFSSGASRAPPRPDPPASASHSSSSAGGSGGIGSVRPRAIPSSSPNGSVRSRLASVLRFACSRFFSPVSRCLRLSRKKSTYSSRCAARRSSSCTEYVRWLMVPSTWCWSSHEHDVIRSTESHGFSRTKFCVPPPPPPRPPVSPFSPSTPDAPGGGADLTKLKVGTKSLGSLSGPPTSFFFSPTVVAVPVTRSTTECSPPATLSGRSALNLPS